jgi:glutathione gamma-glutamylcysteinyltransferase
MILLSKQNIQKKHSETVLPFNKRQQKKLTSTSSTNPSIESKVTIKPACDKFTDTLYIQNVFMKKKDAEKNSFYRRPLPNNLVNFSSAEGKKLFKDAFEEGNMENYFHLASHFHMQTEPAYCGLATLSMVLNSLNIDPARVWKTPWRWFSQEMIKCSHLGSMNYVRKNGISFDTFKCLASCNGAKVQSFWASDVTVDQFRDMVIDVTKGNDRRLVVNYNRSNVGQTGTGHFSPIGGYHSGTDMVLIMDTAQFKYPPHWVSLPLLFSAMESFDSTGKPRGYIILSNPLQDDIPRHTPDHPRHTLDLPHTKTNLD